MSEQKILWFDTETTGVDYKRHGIIQFACIVEIGGEVMEEQVFSMNPVGKEIDQGALKVHGITEEEIKAYPPSGEVKLHIEGLFSRYIDRFDKADKFLPAGYNVRFDMEFMKQLWEDQGDKYFFSWMHGARAIDPLKVIPFLEWSGKYETPENLKLGTVVKAMGIDDFQAHDAMADIRATRTLAYKLRNLIDKGDIQ